MRIPPLDWPNIGIPWSRAFLSALSALSACLLLLACQDFEHPGLVGRTTAPQAGPSCAACHAYPLRDLHHAYHLLNADTLRISKNVNGRISCLDCHNTAMQSREHVILDSICSDFLKPSGWSSVDEQVDFQFCITFNALTRVDTIRQNRPVLMPERSGEAPILLEWMTGFAHMDGKVDVAFDPRVSHAAMPDKARWDPASLTCSAIACHEKHGDYRWASPSRGLGPLRDGEHHQ